MAIKSFYAFAGFGRPHAQGAVGGAGDDPVVLERVSLLSYSICAYLHFQAPNTACMSDERRLTMSGFRVPDLFNRCI